MPNKDTTVGVAENLWVRFSITNSTREVIRIENLQLLWGKLLGMFVWLVAVAKLISNPRQCWERDPCEQHRGPWYRGWNYIHVQFFWTGIYPFRNGGSI